MHPQPVGLFHGPPEAGETVLAYRVPPHVLTLTVVCTGCATPIGV